MYARNTLLGWRLGQQRNRTASTLRFPSSISTVSALHDRVGVVTTTHEVLIWNFGSSMQQVNLGDLRRLKDDLSDDSHIDYGRVFFHPLKAGNIPIIQSYFLMLESQPQFQCSCDGS